MPGVGINIDSVIILSQSALGSVPSAGLEKWTRTCVHPYFGTHCSLTA